MLETLIKLFYEHCEKIIDLVTVEQEHSKMKSADPVEGDTLKWETEIFQDIIKNLMSIVIAGYSFYLLSWADELGNQVRKTKVEDEEKKFERDQNKPTIESYSKYDHLIIDYFKELETLPEGESCEKYRTE